MSVTVAWGNEQRTCIVYHVQDRWDWPALQAAVAEADALLATAEQTVHAIIAADLDTELPLGLMWRFSTLRQTAHPRRGKTIMVSGNRLMQRMFRVFTQIHPGIESRLQFVETQEEALALVAAWTDADVAEALPADMLDGI